MMKWLVLACCVFVVSARYAHGSAKPAKFSQHAVHQVDKDVTSLEEKVAQFPSENRVAAMANLRSIKDDADKLAFSKTLSKARKANLKHALDLRLEALREQARATQPNSEKFDKVASDISSLENEVQKSSLSATLKHAAMQNIQSIDSDVRRFKSAHGAEKDRISQAIHLRTQALEEQLGGGQHEDRSAKVVQDSAQLEELVAESDLSADTRKSATSDIKQIARDAKALSSASGHRKASLTKALDLRLEALREMLNVPAADAKVMSDLKEVEMKVQSMNLSPSKQARALSDLKSMEEDAHKVASSAGATKARFSKALNLRMKALHQILEEDDQGASAKRSQTLNLVKSDIKTLEERIEDSKMPAHRKSEIVSNLNALRRDAAASTHANSAEKASLTKAMHLRVQALQAELAQGEGQFEQSDDADEDSQALEENDTQALEENDSRALEEDETRALEESEGDDDSQ